MVPSLPATGIVNRKWGCGSPSVTAIVPVTNLRWLRPNQKPASLDTESHDFQLTSRGALFSISCVRQHPPNSGVLAHARAPEPSGPPAGRRRLTLPAGPCVAQRSTRHLSEPVASSGKRGKQFRPLRVVASLESLYANTQRAPDTQEAEPRGFPGGPVAKSRPRKAGDGDSSLGQRTGIPHPEGQRGPPTATTDFHTPQLERSVPAATKRPASARTRRSQEISNSLKHIL